MSLEKMINDLNGRQVQVDNPMLVADTGNWWTTHMNPYRTFGFVLRKEMGENDVKSVRELARQKWCVVWHWYRYIKKKGAGGWGIVDPYDEPYRQMTD